MEFRNRGAACRREADKPLSAALLRPLTQPGNCIEIACLPGESRFTAACPILVGLHHAIGNPPRKILLAYPTTLDLRRPA
jgi:hypothetical protein